jgi:hypothetical protein
MLGITPPRPPLGSRPALVPVVMVVPGLGRAGCLLHGAGLGPVQAPFSPARRVDCNGPRQSYPQAEVIIGDGGLLCEAFIFNTDLDSE